MKKSLASEWMKSQGLRWKKNGIQERIGRYRKSDLTDQQKRVLGELPMTIRQFVKSNKGHVGHDCLHVPGFIKGRPASMDFCGKHISAARYMCLLTHGTPKYEGAMVRHLCGNGHLSCVNPKHLVWGDRSDNASDAANHRHAGGETHDRIYSVSRE